MLDEATILDTAIAELETQSDEELAIALRAAAQLRADAATAIAVIRQAQKDRGTI